MNVIIEVHPEHPVVVRLRIQLEVPYEFQNRCPGWATSPAPSSTTVGGGKTNEGVVAAQGTTIVAVVATDTPATLTQVESLVGSLL